MSALSSFSYPQALYSTMRYIDGIFKSVTIPVFWAKFLNNQNAEVTREDSPGWQNLPLAKAPLLVLVLHCTAVFHCNIAQA